METEIQQLSGEFKNIPTDTSLVCSSISSGLNREETLSVQDKVLTDNNLEENQQSSKTGQNLRVSVINLRGNSLMPTTPKKAKQLLKQQKAKVVKRIPFVIQLTTATGETKQEINLGIDSGYSSVGFSATTKKEELISGELKLRKGVSKKIQERSMYRRNRRNKLWYRKLRFNNRKKQEGWLVPSIQHKLDTHIRLIDGIKKWFPITNIIVEVANFDAQKMQNPEISGIEYQQGELQGYEVKEYLLQKFGRKCVYCGKTDVPLEVEHIISKAKGGSNRVSNLAISCRRCNLKKGKKSAEEFGHPEVQKLAKNSLRAIPFMNLVRKRLVEKLGTKKTYGYITKKNRIDNDLDKSHCNDAYIISGGAKQKRCRLYNVTQTRRNNRCLQLNRKGYRPSIRRQRYKLQLNDVVKYDGMLFNVKGVNCNGKRIIFDNKKTVYTKKVELLSYGKGFIYKKVIE